MQASCAVYRITQTLFRFKGVKNKIDSILERLRDKALLLKPIHFGNPAQNLYDEIGRASCRERVSPYV